jgi:hypothetical protein
MRRNADPPRRRAWQFVVPVAVTIVLAMAPAARGQDRTLTVEVGKTKCVGMRRTVDQHRVAATPPGVARGRFDADANRLCVDGERRGKATVTFSGTARRIVVESDLREDPRPFKHTIDVEVLPPPADMRTIPTLIEVEPGKPRRIQVGRFMPPTFGRSNEEYNKWRRLDVAVNGPGIVKVRTLRERGRVFLEFAAVNAGRAEVRLTGEQRIRRDWQEVVRVIDVRVP